MSSLQEDVERRDNHGGAISDDNSHTSDWDDENTGNPIYPVYVNDEALFPGSNKFNTEIKPIKDNSPKKKELIGNQHLGFYSNFTDVMWSRVGQLISGNNHIIKLDVRHSSLSDKKLAALLKGARHNRSLEILKLGRNNFGRKGVASLCSFLQRKKCKLKELDLDFIPLGSQEMATLSSALKKSNDVEVLKLVYTLRGDAEWEAVAQFLSQLDYEALKDLYFGNNGVALEGCRALAGLLRNPNCHLKKLDLRGNRLNDECCSVLTEALRNNNSLETIALDSNYSISDDGLNHFFLLVCGWETIQGTYDSNYTLHCMSFDGSTSTRSRVTQQLQGALAVNSGKSRLQKILRYHFWCKDGEEFDVRPLKDVDVKLMPRILSVLGGKFCQIKPEHLNNLYHLLRHWNLHVLFGFPSAESVRIGSQYAQKMADLNSNKASLEREIVTLRAATEDLKRYVNKTITEKIEMEDKLRLEKQGMENELRNEIAMLREEIVSLKGKVSTSDSSMDSCDHKRKRED